MFVPRRGAPPAVRLMGFMRFAWRALSNAPVVQACAQAEAGYGNGRRQERIASSGQTGTPLWRFRCTCGWIDPKVRWTEGNAINAGNAHVRSARTVVWRADVNAAVATALVKRASDAISAATTAMQREPNSSRAKREIDKAITACGKVRVAIARGQIVGDDARRVQEGLVAFGKAVET